MTGSPRCSVAPIFEPNDTPVTPERALDDSKLSLPGVNDHVSVVAPTAPENASIFMLYLTPAVT